MKEPINDGAHWLPCEDDFLRENRSAMTAVAMSERLGRSVVTVRARIHRTDLARRFLTRVPAPTEAEIEAMMERTGRTLMARVREDIARG